MIKLLNTKIPYKISIRIFAPANQKCWIWLGTTDKNGYPVLWIEGRTQGVHRYLYKLLADPDLANIKDLDHLCRNTSCINPGCLEPVTTIENIRRGKATSLTFGEVVELRNLYKTGKYTHQKLAKKYGVGRSTISMALCGSNWKDVGRPIGLRDVIDNSPIGKLNLDKLYIKWQVKGYAIRQLARMTRVSETTIKIKLVEYEKKMLKKLRPKLKEIYKNHFYQIEKGYIKNEEN